jgi:hypothetical protein
VVISETVSKCYDGIDMEGPTVGPSNIRAWQRSPVTLAHSNVEHDVARAREIK